MADSSKVVLLVSITESWRRVGSSTMGSSAIGHIKRRCELYSLQQYFRVYFNTLRQKYFLKAK